MASQLPHSARINTDGGTIIVESTREGATIFDLPFDSVHKARKTTIQGSCKNREDFAEQVSELLSYSNFTKESFAYSVSQHCLSIAFLMNSQNPDLIIPEAELECCQEAAAEFPELRQFYDELVTELPLRRKYFKMKLASSASGEGDRGQAAGGGGGGKSRMPEVELDVSEDTSFRGIVDYNKTCGKYAVPAIEVRSILDECLGEIIASERFYGNDTFKLTSTERKRLNLEEYLGLIDTRDDIETPDADPLSSSIVDKFRVQLLEKLRIRLSERPAAKKDEEADRDNETDNSSIDDDDEPELSPEFLERMKSNEEFNARKPKPTKRTIELRSIIGDNDGIPLPIIDYRYYTHLADSLKSLKGFSARAFEIADELRKHISLFNELFLVVIGALVKTNPAFQSVLDEWASTSQQQKLDQCYGLERRFFIQPLSRMVYGLIEKHLQGEKSPGDFVQDYLEEILHLDPCNFKGETEFALKFNSIIRKMELIGFVFPHPVERFIRCYENSSCSKRGYQIRKVTAALKETYTTMRRTKEQITLQYIFDLAKTSAHTSADARSTDSSSGQRGIGNSKRKQGVSSSSRPDSNPPNAMANAAAAAETPASSGKGGGKGGKGGNSKGKGKGGKNNFRKPYCKHCKANHEMYGDQCTAQRPPKAQANAAAAEENPRHLRDDPEYLEYQEWKRRGGALAN